MSEVINIETKKPAGNTRMLRAMVGIGILSALLIVMTFELTQPRVQRLKAEALEKAIFKVLPGTVSTGAFGVNAAGALEPLTKEGAYESVVYVGYDENKELTGYAVEAAGQGYADIIRILYGYDPVKQHIIGFQVLESKETPGLGDKIEKEQRFLDNFKALDVSLSPEGKLNNQVVTVKQGEKQHAWEIDGITGATISSRAIGTIIDNSSKEIIPLLYEQKGKMATSETVQKPIENNE